MSNRAVFLDRDGVINENWFNPATGEWESPMRPRDLRLFPGVIAGLGVLAAQGFRLFLVSNQPSAAKGKCTLDDLAAVQARLRSLLDAAGIEFDGFFYSYSHPDGIVPALSGPSPERKPSPYFLERAIAEFDLDRGACWMVGDRDSDIECGQRAGVRTIQIASRDPGAKAGKAQPDFHRDTLAAAATLIVDRLDEIAAISASRVQ